ncbi:maleylpyruvate isomerase family mycothiol-dependent enzyme [Pseudactinotalea sp. HY160]|nr:maleylpyruvate isomerase family mycothiol-dependent enzyme [Pseudactinotalea sp. HY160]
MSTASVSSSWITAQTRPAASRRRRWEISGSSGTRASSHDQGRVSCAEPVMTVETEIGTVRVRVRRVLPGAACQGGAMWSGIERDALVRALLATDPQTPTLCEGWQARHLAAHLYLRRHRPWAMGQLSSVAERAADPAAYLDVVAEFAAPVPARSPLALLDRSDAANLAEYVIHHEDLRRGEAAGAGAVAREFPAEMTAAVLAQLRVFSMRMLRGCPVGVVLATPAGISRVVRTGPAPVTIRGTAADLALALAGRLRAAHVRWVGPPRAIEALRHQLH